MNENYRELANAIVMQAVDDFRKAMTVIKKELPEDANMWQRKSHEAQVMLAEVEVEKIKRFFYSEWFIMLTGCSGGSAFERLVKEYE